MTPIRLTIRLTPGQDDDLIQWLESIEFRAKNRRVKEVLRRGLAASDLSPSPAPVDLGAIRTVVEAAVESALARRGAAVVLPAEADPEDEAERVLDGMGEALML
ncbi:MAG: hypothetical protein ACK4WK_03440 [Anaerolineae bacterium]